MIGDLSKETDYWDLKVRQWAFQSLKDQKLKERMKMKHFWQNARSFKMVLNSIDSIEFNTCVKITNLMYIFQS